MSNEFTIQWAVRLPDGQMFLHPVSGAAVTWSSREGAQYVLDQLREQARAMGVHNYAGALVRRYCTPFIGEADGQDVAAAMIDEITEWLHRQGGKP